MNPRVTKVEQRNTLNSRNQIVAAIVLTYYVGEHGPFTLTTTQDDITSGKALSQMQAFATTINALPGVVG